VLAQRFADLDSFKRRAASGYRLLPMRFIPLDGSRYVLTNICGEYVVLSRPELVDLIEHRLRADAPSYESLLAKHFIRDDTTAIAAELLGLKYRTKLSRLANFTGLHMFVVTLRCESSCVYCQVSRQTEDKTAFDMTEAAAVKAVDLVFRSPSPHLKIEFQGGEPLLAFDRVRFIVERAEQINASQKRDLSFVIATNLAVLNDEIIDYAERHRIFFSTSLDGPAPLHTANRPRPGKNSHALTRAGIKRIQERLGRHWVSALMTTTAASLKQPREIIDEYVDSGLHEVFLRPMSPYGFAARGGHVNKYGAADWLEFYKSGLQRILEINRAGYAMREVYTSLILRKILTPQNPGYVDLQSPSGIAIAGIIYNYDGSVYASDESRMIAETGDARFRLGTVDDTYESIIGNDWLLDTLESSLAESAPICSECGFLPYCGVDPIYHYETQRDVVGNKAVSGWCHRNMEVFRHVLTMLEDSPEDAKILREWVRTC
jgi:uncharacterized protein